MSFSFFKSGEILSPVEGGTGASAFTLGSMVFAGSSGTYTQNNSKLFWDNTSFRLGIGTASPSYPLHVSGDVNLTGIVRISGTQIASTNLGDYSNIVLADGTHAFTGSLNLGGNSLINLGSPINPSDAATKAYADSVAQGLSVKASVRALADSNITLSGTQTIDGVALNSGDRVLLTGQTNAVDNGIYVVASGAWSRSSDMANGSNAAGVFTFVEEGTVYAQTGWVCNDPPANATVGTAFLGFTQFSGAGEVTVGTGLSKTGNTISLITPVSVANGGTGASSFTAHGIILGEGSSALSVTGTGISGQAMLSSGSSADPAYGALNLAGGSSIVTGTLPIANGGTGAASLTGNGILATNSGGTAVTSITSSTANQVIAWNGSTWVAATLSLAYLSDGTNVVNAVTPTSPITASITGHTLSIGIHASSADTANFVVQRDGSGNFVANTISLDGNLLPTVTNVSNIGSSSFRFDTLYLDAVIDYATDLLFKASGTEYFRMSTTGNLGIGTSSPTSNLHVSGSFAHKVHTITASASPYAPANETVVMADASSGNIEVDLPDATTVPDRVYYVKKKDSSSNTVTITSTFSQTIDGAATKVITQQYVSVTVVSDGSNWYIL